jgi:hypothetical protein
MKRINVMVSDEAKKIILSFQEKNDISTLDDTMDKYILLRK